MTATAIARSAPPAVTAAPAHRPAAGRRVSSLYELYPDNGPVRASLAGLARVVEAGGYLV